VRNVLLHLIGNAAAIILTAIVLPNQVDYHGNFSAVVAFALVLGLLNAVLTPILNLLTSPLACLTLGLIRVVVNIFVFLLASWLVPGNVLDVTLLGAAVGSLVAGFVSGFLALALGEGRR
jgi:putative membrane protein